MGKRYEGRPGSCNNIPNETACAKKKKNHLKNGTYKISQCKDCKAVKKTKTLNLI